MLLTRRVFALQVAEAGHGIADDMATSLELALPSRGSVRMTPQVTCGRLSSRSQLPASCCLI